MRTQEKILISLVLVTVVLGTQIALGASDYEVAGRSLRWLPVSKSANNLSDSLTLLANRARAFLDLTSLWYGGISLLALIMIGLVLRMARDGELNTFKSEVIALRGQLAEMEAAKERADRLLQEELRKKKELLEAKESAIDELEEIFRGKIQTLESQLSEKQKLLKGRDGQLEALRSEVSALTRQLAEMRSAKERAESFLQEELRKKKAVLEPEDSTLEEAEDSFRGRI